MRKRINKKDNSGEINYSFSHRWVLKLSAEVKYQYNDMSNLPSREIIVDRAVKELVPFPNCN